MVAASQPPARAGGPGPEPAGFGPACGFRPDRTCSFPLGLPVVEFRLAAPDPDGGPALGLRRPSRGRRPANPGQRPDLRFRVLRRTCGAPGLAASGLKACGFCRRVGGPEPGLTVLTPVSGFHPRACRSRSRAAASDRGGGSRPGLAAPDVSLASEPWLAAPRPGSPRPQGFRPPRLPGFPRLPGLRPRLLPPRSLDDVIGLCPRACLGIVRSCLARDRSQCPHLRGAYPGGSGLPGCRGRLVWLREAGC